MPSIGLNEILLVVIIFLLFFGGTKIPQFVKGVGEAIKEFRSAVKDKEE